MDTFPSSTTLEFNPADFGIIGTLAFRGLTSDKSRMRKSAFSSVAQMLKATGVVHYSTKIQAIALGANSNGKPTLLVEVNFLRVEQDI